MTATLIQPGDGDGAVLRRGAGLVGDVGNAEFHLQRHVEGFELGGDFVGYAAGAGAGEGYSYVIAVEFAQRGL